MLDSQAKTPSSPEMTFSVTSAITHLLPSQMCSTARRPCDVRIASFSHPVKSKGVVDVCFYMCYPSGNTTYLRREGDEAKRSRTSCHDLSRFVTHALSPTVYNGPAIFLGVHA